MKFYFSLILAFLFFFKGVSQCTFNDYEKYIDINCFNCNISESNKLIYLNCLRSDSILISNQKRFYDKVEHSNWNVSQKNKVKKTYRNIFESLKKTRSNIYSNYNNLTKDGDNTGYISIFYWYYTDKMIAILVDIEATLFGDL
jgi:hypothetical protein